MRGLLIGAALTMSLVGAAKAADLGRMPVKAPVTATLYNWTGFYVGGNFGYGVGHNSSEPFLGAPPTDRATLAPRGVLAGVQGGYNWQVNSLVVGVEADWQWTDERDTYCFSCAVAIGRGVGQEIPWFGTLRGRVGYAAGSVLFYATGGVAYGQIKQIIDCCFGAPTAIVNNTKTGWVAGGGIEAALAGNWTAKAEYLYTDFGNVSNVQLIPVAFGGPATQVASGDVRNHVGRVGVNYRFGGQGYVPSGGGASASAYNWTGVYLGGNLGYGVGRNATTQAFAGVLTDRLTIGPDGVLGGGQIGYNWQSGAAVIGLEGDIQGTDQRDTICRLCQPTAGFLYQNFTQEVSWFATVRGRLGYASGPALFYVTGGAAFGEIKTTVNQQSPPLNATSQFTNRKAGWTLGGGVEAALLGNWSVKAEYLYLDLGSISQTVIAPGFTASTLVSDVRDHVARVGLNYRFGSSPVVAKY